VSPAGSLSGRATLSFGGGGAGASGATGQRFTGVGFLTLKGKMNGTGKNEDSMRIYPLVN